MKLMYIRRMNRVCLACMLASVAVSSGCQQTLFAPSDEYNESRTERYYGEQSAKQARAARERAADMGFTFATGGGAGDQ